MNNSRKHPSWLDTAVFYELYPQSFYDSNADGIGDLPGIVSKLDYIQSLGCNAIWLNPCFVSPFGDAGYDISDFYQVAPRYGTNADLEELFREVHRRDMHIILDLVAGHTSVDHPWFKASCQREPNKYSNWYIWTSSVWEGAPPPMQQVNGYCERDGNYITNFFHFQPALNYGFANPDPTRPWQLPVNHPDVQAVHQEMRKIMTFWLEKGADGFRVDMASSLIRSDDCSEGIKAFWQEVRAWYDVTFPDAVLVAEWSNPEVAIEAGFHIDFMIHFGSAAYTELFRAHTTNDVLPSMPISGQSFFHRDGKGDISAFLTPYLEHFTKTKGRGFISLPTGNHDLSRIRGSRSDAELKLVYAFIFTMPGVPFIYQGDEIGMRQIDDLPSKEGGYVRTGARTPLQWDASANAGFSTAPEEELYLPIDPDLDRPTIESQEGDSDSVLHFVRQMANLRAAHPALQIRGDFVPLHAVEKEYPFVYLRMAENEKLAIALNPSGQSAQALLAKETLPWLGAQIAGEPMDVRDSATHLILKMPAVSFAVFKA